MKDSYVSGQKKDVPELSKFDWQDPLLIEDDLSESERLLIKSDLKLFLMTNIVELFFIRKINNLFITSYA